MIDIEYPAPGIAKRYFQKMCVMGVTEKMTRYGWLVDRDRLRIHQKDSLDRVDHFTSRFCECTGLSVEALGPSGAGGTNAVREFFFDELRAPIVALSKEGTPQLNAPTLIEWATKDRSAPYASAAACLYAIRKNRTLADFCATYIQFSNNDGRIHFAFNPLGTQTGRWTSSTRHRVVTADSTGSVVRRKISVNAQQIPKKKVTFDFGNGEGPILLAASLRDCFLADPGTVLLRADYDQLELRLIAYLYGVRALIDALDNGIDIHLLTASVLFRELGITVTSDKSNPRVSQCREAAKTCAYAISYQMCKADGMGRYPTLHKNLKEKFPSLTERQTTALVIRFFDLYPEIREGQLKVKERIDKFGYSELAIDGRRLYYPATPRGYQQALNFPQQGTGGCLADLAVVELDPLLNWEGGEQIRGQVHDELVVQAPYSEAERVGKMLEQAMSRPAQVGETYTGIPADSDPGLDWGRCMKFKEFRETYPNLLP